MEALPQAAAELLRGGDVSQTIVLIKDGNPAGRHVVIMDDLGEPGATLVECKKLLFADGAIKVSAYVTHGVFPKKSWERFLHGEGDGGGEGERERCLTYFWMTDSFPFTAEAVEGTAPFEVLSLDGSIGDALQVCSSSVFCVDALIKD